MRTRPTLRRLATVCLLGLALSSCSEPSPEVAWMIEDPADHGFDRGKLDALRAELEAKQTATLLIAHRGAIVFEWYGPEQSTTTQHYTASIAKTLVGGFSLMLAVNDDAIELDAPAWRYIPHWKDDPKRSRITIRQLVTHTSGLSNRDASADWSKRFWDQAEPIAVALQETPLEAEPGERFVYSSPGFGALGYAVTSALQRKGVRESVQELLRARITRPLRIPDAAWSMGYGTAFEIDGLRVEPNWGGSSFTARALARIGQLMVDEGRFRGEAILEPDLVALALGGPEVSPPDLEASPVQGLGWWSNRDRIWPSLPTDASAALGANDQILLVVPSLDLVVVRMGHQFPDADSTTEWTRPEPHLFRPLREALGSEPDPPATR